MRSKTPKDVVCASCGNDIDPRLGIDVCADCSGDEEDVRPPASKPSKPANKPLEPKRRRVKADYKPSKPLTPQARKQLMAAYRTFELDPRAVSAVPQITHVLNRLPGKIPQAIEFLRGSDQPEAQQWLGLYDDLPASLQRILPFEAICLKAGLTTKRMLEVVTGACFEQSDTTSKLLAAAAHPKIVEATVDVALNEGSKGAKDREMLHKHKNFLPVKDGKAVFVAPGGIGQQNNLLNSGNSTTDNRVTYQVTEIVNIERAQGRAADRYNESLGMGAGKPPLQLNEYQPEVRVLEQEMEEEAGAEAAADAVLVPAARPATGWGEDL